jgi:hypothetical protein
MNKNASDKIPRHLRRAAMAVIAAGIVMAPAVHANPVSTESRTGGAGFS